MSSLIIRRSCYHHGRLVNGRSFSRPHHEVDLLSLSRVASRSPPNLNRQLFNKARSGAQRKSKSLTSFKGSGRASKPIQFGPQNTSWGTSFTDVGPVPRSFYLRHENTILKPRYSGSSAWFGLTAITGINVIVFGYWNEPGVSEEFMMENFTTNVTNTLERPWSLSTASISHKDGVHILGNLFAMWLFGFSTYRVIGAWEFAKVYVLGGIACSTTHVLQNLALGRTQPPLSREERELLERTAESQGIQNIRDLPPQLRQRVESADKPSLGASGSVMALSAVTACLFPLDNVRINPRMFYVPLPVAVGMFVASDLIGITQEGSPSDHAGHLGGLAFGGWYALNSWNSGRWGTRGTLPIIFRFKQFFQQRR